MDNSWLKGYYRLASVYRRKGEFAEAMRVLDGVSEENKELSLLKMSILKEKEAHREEMESLGAYAREHGIMPDFSGLME